jgi:putative aldouronate transport system substrate-binding protein
MGAVEDAMPSERTAAPTLSRRTALKHAVVGASAVALGSSGLAGCKSGADAKFSAAKSVPLPKYLPRDLVRPDLPSGDGGIVEAGYLSFPHNPTRAARSVSFDSLSSLVLTYSPPPPPVSRNTYWKAVDKRLGGTVSVDNISVADYKDKVATILAGNDIPDTVLMDGDQLTMQDLPQLLDKRFADLSDLLSGDGIKDYPNLANIPTYAWRSARVGGRIYGVPVEQSPITSAIFARLDLLADQGIKPDTIKTTDDFRDVCKQLTSPKANRWALGSIGDYMMQFFAAAFGAPNNWARRANGSLVKDWETDEYLAALEYHVDLGRIGVLWPDFAGASIIQSVAALDAGHTVFTPNGIGAWGNYIEVQNKPLSQYGLLLPFTHGTAKSRFFLSPGIFSVTMLRKDSARNVKCRLEVLDLLAAPFGSQEYLLLNYGVEGVDYEMVHGQPALTGKGKQELTVNFGFIGAPPAVIYSNKTPGFVRALHEWESKVAPAGVSDPTVGLYSQTASRQAAANTAVTNTINDVLARRKPISAFKDAVSHWKTQAGNKIRDEYEKQLD